MRTPSFLLLLLVAGSPATATALELTPQLERSARIVEYTWETGRPLMFLDELVPRMATRNEAQWNEFQERLGKGNLPPLGESLPQARMLLAQQNLWSAMPRPVPREVDLVVPALRKRIDAIYTEVKADPLMRDSLSTRSLLGYHQAIHNSRLLDDQLETARRLADYLQRFGKGVPRTRYRELNSIARTTLEEDYASQALKSHGALLADLQECQIDLCLKRFDAACRALHQPGISPDHLLGSVTCEADFHLINDYLKMHRPADLSRAALQDPQLRKRLYADASRLRRETSHADLAPKMKVLFQALYWWSRGRYGMGPEAWGLIKSEAALRVPGGQFAIYMPPLPLQPVDPVPLVNPAGPPADPLVPTCDRRHHYVWAWENRSLDPRAICLQQDERALPWSCQVSPELQYWAGEARIGAAIRANKELLRLVGYFEYTTALKLFEQVLPKLSAKEFAAVDALIKADDQYTIYVNLSRRFPNHERSTLTDRPHSDDTFARYGLPWMMALARIEVHAMHSAFTNTQNPFNLNECKTLEERKAYFRLLVDAMMWHYFALGQDPVLRVISTSSVPDQVALAYQRRINLVLTIVSTFDNRVDKEQFVPQEHRELEMMKATMIALRQGISQEVQQRMLKWAHPPPY